MRHHSRLDQLVKARCASILYRRIAKVKAINQGDGWPGFRSQYFATVEVGSYFEVSFCGFSVLLNTASQTALRGMARGGRNFYEAFQSPHPESRHTVEEVEHAGAAGQD